VLNRMKIEDDLERLRREGQATAVEYGLAQLVNAIQTEGLFEVYGYWIPVFAAT
jgi:hypothetical protein